ncbi:putative ABC transport system permease protein [Fibrobacter sp. UWH9]|uniref:ABC transporter permease n=1 Tax=unclassified Fibrobacter TaxID=2634177 RepID=UPI000914C342|nr:MULTISPECIES: ABC transporter permease [Fibrobacter]MCQ2099750.1 ABC transporter permease [Fibrobacter sp.]MCL4102044.1 Macrolide export ATP-binding/permease protein MacB [Fibrobacter succinogenes]MDO4946550.1 ABC transporter permease [Fibrobacter sp.]OWV16587.1 multidrug ABC transporter substrate-binding protein [Fibrobacter sp. UWH1]SHH17380.1 putative ABC transport system permease protein [Fibrobacter sp. UWH9]
MGPITLVKIAVKALFRNRMRTFLSVLGIVIGVAAVIAMVAMGEGSKQSIKEQMTSMGTNAIIVMPNRDRRGGVQTESAVSLEEEDVIEIRNRAQFINGVSPMITANGQAIAGNNNSPTQLSGISSDYLKIRNYEIEDGVMFDDEADRMSKVCVIGQSVIKNLFPDTDPIGKTIRYKSIPLKVIGTLKAKGSGDFGQDQDDVIFTPYQTVMKRFNATTEIRQIYANSIGEGYAEQATEEIMGILKERRSWTKPTDPFRIFTQEEMITMMTNTSDMLSLVLTAIAGISLLVGGIGIMNIMYVSVTERTKEIGLRMAIGARGRDILLQFLIESVMISLLGGLIGIGLGIGASQAVKSILNWPMSVSITSVVVSFGVCFVTGVFFGWYPARKASRLDPIDALRFE